MCLSGVDRRIDGATKNSTDVDVCTIPSPTPSPMHLIVRNYTHNIEEL